MNANIKDLGNTQQITTWGLVSEYLKPIAHLFEMDGITEIMVNSYDSIFIEKNGELIKTDITFKDEYEIDTAIRMVARAVGDSADDLDFPIVNARLPDGSRFCGTLAPIAANGSDFAIRVFPKEVFSDIDLLERKSFTEEMRNFFELAVKVKTNILLSGGTGSGKTTMLNILASYIDKNESVVTIEDTRELKLSVPSWRSYETGNRKQLDPSARPITLPYLIEMSLRKNPDRILVGEMRDSAAVDAFLQAINTGHSGCLTTTHANSPFDAVERLKNLIASDGKPASYIDSQVRSNLNLIIQAVKLPGHGRLIQSVAEVSRDSIIELFSYDSGQRKHVGNAKAIASSRVMLLAKQSGFV